MKGRAASVFVIVVATVCVAVAACAAALLLYLGTPGGQRRIATMVESITSPTNGYRVRIEGLEISLPALLSADAVHLSSIEGEWLTAREVSLVIDAPALLSGSVRAVDLHIGELVWSALPPGEQPAENAGPSTWPREIDVARLHVGRAFVAASLIEVLGSAAARTDDSADVGPIALDGSVRYRFGDNRLDVRASATAVELRGGDDESIAWHVFAPRVDLVLDDLLERASVRGRVSAERAQIGTARATAAELSVDLRPVRAGATMRRVGRFRADVAVDLRSPTIDGLDSALLGESVSLQASLGMGTETFPLEIDSLTLRGAGFAADARATVSSRSVLADSRVDIKVTDIALLGLPLHASARLGVSASGDLEADEGVVSEADFAATDIDWSRSGLPVAVTNPLGDTLSTVLHAVARRDADSDALEIDVRTLQLRCGSLTASSDGLAVRGPDRRIEGGLDVALPELAPWSDALGRAVEGAAGLRIDLRGPLAAPQASVQLQVAPVRIEGLPMTAFAARSDHALLKIPTSARVQANATTATGAVKAAGTLSFAADGSLGLHDAELATAQNRIALNVDFAPAGELARLIIDADLPSFAELGELVGVSAAGRAKVEMRHDPAAGRPSTLRSTLALVDLPTIGVGVHGIEIDAEANALDTDAPARATLSVSDLRYRGIELDRLDVVATRRERKWGSAWEVEDEQGGVEASFAVDVAETDGTWLARAHALEGILGKEPAAFSRDAVWERAEDGTMHWDVGIAVGEGELDAKWTVDGQSQFGRIDADEFPLRYVAVLVDPALQIDGLISAEIFVPEHLDASATIEELPRASIVLTDVRSRTQAEFPGFGLKLVARRAQRELRFSGDLDSTLGGGLHAEGVVKADAASAVPIAGIGPDSPLEATLTGGLGEQAVAELAALADQRLRGRLDADVRVRGRVGAPVLGGTLSFSEGHYDARITAIELTDIHAELRASRSGHGEITMTAKDGDHGRVAARGDLDLSAGIMDPALDVEIELTRLRAARLDEAKVTVDGELRLVARARQLSLSGTLKASEVDVSIPERRPANVVVLDVVEHNVEVLERIPRRQAANRAGPPIGLDVRIEVPGPAFVRGRDLTTEWRGAAHVAGISSQPRLDGQLELIRGDLTVLGARFQAAYGTIQFDPTPWTVPHVNVRGDMRRAGVNVSVIVSGPLTDLSIDFQSDPPMPRDEILSFVLFGTSVGNLTTLQAVRLAAAVAAIARPGGGLNPMGWVRRSTGLDRVEVGESEAYDDTYVLSAGKYLKEGVYLSVEQPLGEGASEVAVDLDVTKTITLRSSVGADASGSLGATWSYDY